MRQPTELHMEAKCLAIWPCMEKPAAGTGSPGCSPYNLGINRSKKNPRNGIVENSVSGIISSDPDAVGAGHRPAKSVKVFRHIEP